MPVSLKHLREVADDLYAARNFSDATLVSDAIAEISALRAAAVGVNVGVEMALVPREPTDAMIEAGEEEILCRRQAGAGVFAADIYAAMIVAALSDEDVGVNVGVSASTKTVGSDTSTA